VPFCERAAAFRDGFMRQPPMRLSHKPRPKRPPAPDVGFG
jgi:hypothetical protein